VVVLSAAVVLATVMVVGVPSLAWWSMGGGLDGAVAAALIAPLSLLVAHRIWLFAVLLLWDGGSSRQAKRRLHEAETSGRGFATLRARAEVALLRSRRRG
jgi:hypothetical protein